MSSRLSIHSWTTDWPEFVKYMAELFRDGMPDRGAAEKVAGTSVRWTGEISSIETEKGKVEAIALNMGRVRVPLEGGWVFEGGHISLPIRASHLRDKCQSLEPGTSLEFVARLLPKESIFPAVSFARDEKQQKVFLISALENVEVPSLR